MVVKQGQMFYLGQGDFHSAIYPRGESMRIVTRPDFDGIVCAVLLYEAENIDAGIYWVEPSEIQSGVIAVQQGDIIANLPFDPHCSLWFDHHVSNKPTQDFKGAFDIAPSAARVVYEYYKNLGKLDARFDELVQNTDIIDAADLDEVWRMIQIAEEHFGAQSKLPGYQEIPRPGDVFAHYRHAWPIGHPRENENVTPADATS